MKKRMIGNLEVSEIGMGCMGFSHGYGQVPEADYSIEAMRMAHESGCTFYDTAEVYGDVVFHPGHNEQLVGKAIKDFRKDIVLATKFFIHTQELENGTSVYEAIRRHLEESMKNLGTDYIDLYYLHRINYEIPVEEVAEAMGRIIREGIVRAWGLSQVNADTLAKAHTITPVSAVQNLYSMLERDCEKDIFPFCQEHSIGVVPFSPIASGFLSGKIKADTSFEKVDDVRHFVPQLKKENILANQPILDIITGYAERKQATPAQISLSWMLHKYPNVVPIPGSKNKERILENLGATNVELTSDELHALEKALDTCIIYGYRGHVEAVQTNFGKNWEKQKKEGEK
ncbi:aldo/keto reductase [Parabacteroides sp.]|uniref:aldo/keto reductase n=1 Tax=Parabacteroides sp. TaxID=1869337 RepID=UPI0026E00B3E|nr:aldo/keto reductase [Parabacteroides sp.]MDO5428684.1 aldo/keto reductase [Parabacteroides sp.]